ncbi:hypothetical protein [Aeromicrobium sp. 179-A 4D2 NHS]|uniref:hypothetical protein n=1 Tax=Aeromicrobium sp. 179-A 4D2 NHS TaxID=3142375 RepID=UPI0039A275BC
MTIETFDDEQVEKVCASMHHGFGFENGHPDWDTNAHREGAAWEVCRVHTTATAQAALSAIGQVEVEKRPAEWLDIPTGPENKRLLSVNGAIGLFYRHEMAVFMFGPRGEGVHVCNTPQVTSVEPVSVEGSK